MKGFNSIGNLQRKAFGPQITLLSVKDLYLENQQKAFWDFLFFLPTPKNKPSSIGLFVLRQSKKP